MNTQHNLPRTLDDYILLFTEVRKKYGNLDVVYITDNCNVNDVDEHLEFSDVLISGGYTSLCAADESGFNEVPRLVLLAE